MTDLLPDEQERELERLLMKYSVPCGVSIVTHGDRLLYGDEAIAFAREVYRLATERAAKACEQMKKECKNHSVCHVMDAAAIRAAGGGEGNDNIRNRS